MSEEENNDSQNYQESETNESKYLESILYLFILYS